MKNSHLVAILKTFNKKEIRELRKWLRSPVHNQREDVMLLFDYLTTGNHLNNEKQLEKERIYSRLFKGETSFDDAKMRQVIHFLLKEVEEFLIYYELNEDAVRSKMALASVYRKRKLNKAFQKTIRQLRDLQENTSYRNGHFIRNEYLIEQEEYQFLSDQMQVRNKSLGLQEVSDALDNTYFADKLRQSCLMLAHQAVHKAGYTIGLLDDVLKYVEENQFYEYPAIGIYYYGYKSIVDKNTPEHFLSLKKQIQEHGHLFPHAEARDIFLMAINYCIGKMNAGEESFVREAFELYSQGFEEGILLENGIVSRWTFLNVVLIALRLKEFNWAKHFITDYQQHLKEEHRENFVHYSTARLHFEKKDYTAAMRLLMQFEYNDILINLNAKSMLMKMFYEQDELDALESLLESMRTYMQRKTIMSYHKSNYKNIIRFTKKLVRTNPYNKKDIEKLEDEIKEANPLTERKWLLEQLEAL